jgi:aminoglycoside 3-N-acetyltransferase
MDYNYKDIREAFKRLGVEKKRVVLIRTDLKYLGRYENHNKNEILKAYFDVLADLVDLSEGTIVVPTASFKLCNTDIPFDLENTPSEMGVLTEYVRKKKEAIRSFHPFVSHAAIGKEARDICEDTARHAYGPETPKARMLERDALCVSIGIHPHLTCATIHHIEMIMGVPYRYPKEYFHPVVRNGEISYECFYLYVWYKECNLKRNRCVNIFNHFCQPGDKVKFAKLGRGKVYSYPMVEFYDSTTKLLSKDIYAWLDEIPEIKPYRRFM